LRRPTARGISASVRRAVDERPEKLAEPEFRDELVDLLCAYVLGDPGRDGGGGPPVD
jgi:hypothetical protein